MLDRDCFSKGEIAISAFLFFWDLISLRIFKNIVLISFEIVKQSMNCPQREKF